MSATSLGHASSRGEHLTGGLANPGVAEASKLHWRFQESSLTEFSIAARSRVDRLGRFRPMLKKSRFARIFMRAFEKKPRTELIVCGSD